MAQLIRSAKSGSDWTNADLLAYNISITPTSPAPSLDHLDSTILTSPTTEDPTLSESTADYLGYLDLATHATQESATATLRLLGFNARHTTARAAQTDVCIIYLRGQPVLEVMTIPCITMFGPTPTFYLVPVTRELSDAVMTAQYPTSETRVLKYVTVAAHQRRISDGMADPEFRKLALKRFLAFKSLAKSY
ncbi:hypothetical protein FA15DRAFT_682699 [Coprinopsis marcescibilis]|uniref:Uncharacterized protein n=1 Tax=Coprinopsis marcescibilis TaxID=230819 RepID=A0A5C3KJ27_COPMA|nr:hypothetical protein FA15DRAFT_682699 [Coprinopsis marcescibilis]